MGLIRVSLQLLNPSKPEVRGLEVSALTDSGAVNLYIPRACNPAAAAGAQGGNSAKWWCVMAAVDACPA